MAADLRHTLLNLEVPPPAGEWNAIATRLDTEFDAAEITLSEKLADYELAPPTQAWQNIEAAIVDDPEEVEAAPIITINRSFRKWAAAAAAIVLVALGGWYFLNNSTTPNNSMTLVPEAKAEEKTVAPPASNDLPEVTASTDQAPRPLPRRSGTLVASARKLNVTPAGYASIEPEYNPGLTTSDYLPHSGLPHIRAVNSAYSPNVEAPPIRDANGNIILDTELIFAPDNNYIVVTGPNGEQTRISSKFLPLLSSMNGNIESMDYFQFFLNENNIWKLRFNEWRDRMLRQATIIPTATNLLDIIQLKEFLQEN